MQDAADKPKVGIEGNVFTAPKPGTRLFSADTLIEYKIVKRKHFLTYEIVKTHKEGTTSVSGAITIYSK